MVRRPYYCKIIKITAIMNLYLQGPMAYSVQFSKFEVKALVMNKRDWLVKVDSPQYLLLRWN